MRRWWIIGVILLNFLSGAWTSHPAREIRQGNAFYVQGRYDEALREYAKALEYAPRNAMVHYNRGNALYRLGRYPEAMRAYLAALSESRGALAADAYFNLGNAAFRHGDLERAIAAYQDCLRLRPEDRDAKYNLEWARRQLEQQKQRAPDVSSGSSVRSQAAQRSQKPPERPEPGEFPNDVSSQIDRRLETSQSLADQDLERLLESIRQNEKRLQRQILFRRLKRSRRVSLEKDW